MLVFLHSSFPLSLKLHSFSAGFSVHWLPPCACTAALSLTLSCCPFTFEAFGLSHIGLKQIWLITCNWLLVEFGDPELFNQVYNSWSLWHGWYPWVNCFGGTAPCFLSTLLLKERSCYINTVCLSLRLDPRTRALYFLASLYMFSLCFNRKFFVLKS